MFKGRVKRDSRGAVSKKAQRLPYAKAPQFKFPPPVDPAVRDEIEQRTVKVIDTKALKRGRKDNIFK